MKVEKSKSNRAVCRVCGKKLENGELRVCETAFSPYLTFRFYFHVKCWVRKNLEFLASVFKVIRSDYELAKTFFNLVEED